MYDIKSEIANPYKHQVLDEVAKRSTLTHYIHYVGTGAVHRQEGEEGKDEYERPKGFIAFDMWGYPFAHYYSFWTAALKRSPRSS